MIHNIYRLDLDDEGNVAQAFKLADTIHCNAPPDHHTFMMIHTMEQHHPQPVPKQWIPSIDYYWANEQTAYILSAAS